MEEGTGAVAALVVEACDLVDEGARLGVRDDRLMTRAALLHAELLAELGATTGPEAAADVAGAAAELDVLVARLDRLPVHVPALTG